MKKLSTILLTMCIISLTFSKVFASCEEYSRNALSNSNLRVQYVYYGGNTGTVNATSGSSSVLTPNTTESIRNISKPIYTTFSGDYLILQGTLEVLAVGDQTQDNPNSPVISNISPPIIQLSNNADYEAYCEDLGFSPNFQGPTYLGEYMPASSTTLTPRLASYTFTLKCHRHQNFPTTRDYYRINFYVGFNNFYNDGYTTNTPYRITVIFREYSVNVTDTCTNEQIIETIDSVNDSITDINNSITDSDVTGAVDNFSDKYDDWSYNDHGLSAFVSSPLNFIRGLANAGTCQPLALPPLLGNTSTFELPCIMEEFEDRFPSLFTIYQLALYFFVCYRIGIDLFMTVHKLKDPLNDEISVADL